MNTMNTDRTVQKSMTEGRLCYSISLSLLHLPIWIHRRRHRRRRRLRRLRRGHHSSAHGTGGRSGDKSGGIVAVGIGHRVLRVYELDDEPPRF